MRRLKQSLENRYISRVWRYIIRYGLVILPCWLACSHSRHNELRIKEDIASYSENRTPTNRSTADVRSCLSVDTIQRINDDCFWTFELNLYTSGSYNGITSIEVRVETYLNACLEIYYFVVRQICIRWTWHVTGKLDRCTWSGRNSRPWGKSRSPEFFHRNWYCGTWPCKPRKMSTACRNAMISFIVCQPRIGVNLKPGL